MYSGKWAAWAYKNIDPTAFKRVFILGGAHIYDLPGGCLTTCTQFATPLGNIKIDTKTTEILSQKDGFEYYGKKYDEHEHCIELHLPYIKKIFGEQDIELVPIMFGKLTYEEEVHFGEILAEFLNEPQTLFIISTDFCHWGANYNFYPHDKNISEDIQEYVEYLDKQGMDIIENKNNGKGFVQYCEDTKNNICGRHPIAVFLEALKAAGIDEKSETKFINVDHTQRIESREDSSVTYASAYTVIDE